MSRIALSLLLVCACVSIDAREIRLSGANGDGGSCPDLTATVASDAADKSRATTQPVRAKPAKPATTRATGDGGRVSTPRWHSFLPGMFR
jgi:hypothetical protein